MTSHIGFGSDVSGLITTNTTTAIVAAGNCVVDKIFVNNVGVGVLNVDLQDAAGNSTLAWTGIDVTNADAQRHGISCGPCGIRIQGSGLRVVTAGGTTFNITVAYRSGLL